MEWSMLKASILTIGFGAAALGCYGAYEQALKTDGGYLVIAAPVVALAAALVPYFAERAWKAKQKVKALIWWLVLIPVAATLFFATAERVHFAKAGAETERSAQRAAVARADRTFEDARVAVVSAEFDAKAARKLPQKPVSNKAKAGSWCDTSCLKNWDAAADKARKVRDEAAEEVTKLQAKAPEESPYKAPVWLLPAALDLVAFVSIWTGLAMPGRKKVVVKVKRRRRKASPPRPKTPVQLRVVS